MDRGISLCYINIYTIIWKERIIYVKWLYVCEKKQLDLSVQSEIKCLMLSILIFPRLRDGTKCRT